MPIMHFNTIVQGQYCPIMFLIRNIFWGLGLYPTPTVIATCRNCRGELGGCTSTLVSHLAEETVSWNFDTLLDISMEALLPRRRTVVSDGRDDSTKWLDRTSFFVAAVLLSTFIFLFLLSSSVTLSYFYLAVLTRGCLGKHSCMSSPFPIAILNGPCSLRAIILFCGDVPAIKN